MTTRSSADRNCDGLTFTAWMRQVDAEIARLAYGLTSGDLADQCYWDAWHAGTSPADMAEQVLEDEGFPFDAEGF